MVDNSLVVGCRDLEGVVAAKAVVSSKAVAEGLSLRLIGPPLVRSEAVSLTGQQQALIAYIGLCGPVSAEEIALALWQGRVMSTSRLPNLLAETRRVVGHHLLPSAQHGYYRLSGVHSDIDRLDSLCSSRDRAKSDWLVSALAMLADIGGPPLHRPVASDKAYWVWLEDCFVQRAHVERQISRLAFAVVDRTASLGLVEQSIWAIEQALKAVPHDDALRRALLSWR